MTYYIAKQGIDDVTDQVEETCEDQQAKQKSNKEIMKNAYTQTEDTNELSREKSIIKRIEEIMKNVIHDTGKLGLVDLLEEKWPEATFQSSRLVSGGIKQALKDKDIVLITEPNIGEGNPLVNRLNELQPKIMSAVERKMVRPGETIHISNNSTMFDGSEDAEINSRNTYVVGIEKHKMQQNNKTNLIKGLTKIRDISSRNGRKGMVKKLQPRNPISNDTMMANQQMKTAQKWLTQGRGNRSKRQEKNHSQTKKRRKHIRRHTKGNEDEHRYRVSVCTNTYPHQNQKRRPVHSRRKPNDKSRSPRPKRVTTAYPQSRHPTLATGMGDTDKGKAIKQFLFDFILQRTTNVSIICLNQAPGDPPHRDKREDTYTVKVRNKTRVYEKQEEWKEEKKQLYNRTELLENKIEDQEK
ncbi:hypothetical protein ILUMI_09257 [Ignelater luminosus]|uniref:Uncharacterized protein n=1 Tax=Ignelater luminosus TaxID=2038154 RepID=A0A8K0D037_IGNLU|nr:hypothetical protein ILUMI_09257 [Ignelater luminosus]